MGQFGAYGQRIYVEEKEYNISSFFFSSEAIHPLSCEVIRYFFSPSIPRFLPTFLFHSSLRLVGHPTEFLFFISCYIFFYLLYFCILSSFEKKIEEK